MKNRTVIATLMMLLLTASLAIAGTKADFSGAWTLDKSRSEGLPPEMDQTMTITQEGDKLSLETTLITGEEKQSVKDSYTLSGAPEEFAPRVGVGASGKGKRTAKWSADGNGIEVTEEAKFETPDGDANTTMKRKWQLSADGKTLTIELNFNGPNGDVTSKRTFVKK